MKTNQDQITFLIGTQFTTGMTHLTTTSGKARATRYGLSVEENRGTLENIKCYRCREIAQKQINKSE